MPKGTNQKFKLYRLAQIMLENTDDSIENIAEKLGYMNTGHFRRMFKNYFGIPPSRYRRINTDRTDPPVRGPV